MEALRHRIAIEKLKEKIIMMIDISNEEIKEATENKDIAKLAFHEGALVALNCVIEDIYTDTIILE